MRVSLRSCLLILLMAVSLPAQSWDTLRGLKIGDRIRVLDAEGKNQRGTFSALADDSLTLQTRKGPLSIDRARVRKVDVRSNSRRLRNFLIGSGIGVATGVAIDQTLGALFRNESGQDDGLRALTYIAPIALFGGLSAFPAYRTLYRAP